MFQWQQLKGMYILWGGVASRKGDIYVCFVLDEAGNLMSDAVLVGYGDSGGRWGRFGSGIKVDFSDECRQRGTHRQSVDLSVDLVIESKI